MEPYELAYCEEVRSLIRRRAAALRSERAALMARMREAGKRIAEDAPFAGLYTGGDGETDEVSRHIADMERDGAVAKENAAEAAFLDRLLPAPYFGRVDFSEEDTAPETYYIGLRTIIRDSDGRVFTCDWRAPVSSLFYGGEVGRAAYDAPGGTVSGEITRIRQYRFEEGELAACWDADLRIGDELLRDALSGAAAQKMRAVVSTIQRDQNRAIRADAAKNLTVFGPAGCGKTTVGMHRLAWLMYEARAAKLKPDLLLFTANEAFRAYVSGVLPELGEEEVAACTYGELFRRHLRGFAVEDALLQTEALLSGDPAREQYIRAVYDAGFTSAADDALSRLPAHFITLSLFGRTVLPAAVLREKYGKLAARTVRDRLAVLGDWAEEEIRSYFLRHKQEILGEVIRRMGETDADAAAFARLRKHALKNARDMIGKAVETDAARLYRCLFAAQYGKNEAYAALERRLADRRLFFEDGVVLLYIKAALGMCREKNAPTHILLDEAQDYAPLQHKTLRRLYPGAVFTVLADVNQSVVPAAGSLSAEEIASVYGTKPFVIEKSYRSTLQIGRFAKRFLPHADYGLFGREGPEPVFHEAAHAAQKAAQIIRRLPEAYRSVCVILRTVRETKRFFGDLKRLVPEAAAVTDAKSAAGARVLCMPAALVKGLEFDAVILPDFDGVSKNSRLAYLMTTRALHELHLIR